MTHAESRVTIHMAASLDGSVARRDERLDWCVGGTEMRRLGPVDEVAVFDSAGGDGISFFHTLHSDVAIHLAEVNAYMSGIFDLRYEVPLQPQNRAH